MAEFVGAVGARIQREWIQYYTTLPEKLDIVMGVDLAISLKQDADYTAVCVLGRAKDGKIYVLALERVRASFGEQQTFIKQLADKYKPRVVAIEQVGYQDSMIQQMQATTKLNIRGIKVTKDKISRFAPLEARFEHGQIYLNKDLPVYVENELLEFPVGEHDDTIDSISIAWEALGPQQNLIATPAYDVREDIDWRS
jgi:predicted phage terminase large subunit-like protein